MGRLRSGVRLGPRVVTRGTSNFPMMLASAESTCRLLIKHLRVRNDDCAKTSIATNHHYPAEHFSSIVRDTKAYDQQIFLDFINKGCIKVRSIIFEQGVRLTGRLAVVGTMIFLSLSTGASPAIARIGEDVPPGEAAAIETIVATVDSIVGAAAQAGERPVLRDAHAKAHGCVHALVTIRRDLPAALRQGVFAKPRSYPAWIRFSNGNGAPQDDHAGDGRGMALKLLGVRGPKLLADERSATTQDFVMINYPVFFVRNAADYVTFTGLTKANMANQFFAAHPREQKISRAITAQVVDHVFEQRYFSMTPYRLGAGFIKFSARPVVCGTNKGIVALFAAPPRGDTNYLRDDMITWLGEKDACFEFGIQTQTDPASMPVEDPTVEWDQARSPFIGVADIVIPRQQFASPAQQSYCENLSFTPWHTLAAHEPVGGINRVRRQVYQAISRLRHRLNNAPRAEPADLIRFVGAASAKGG